MEDFFRPPSMAPDEHADPVAGPPWAGRRGGTPPGVVVDDALMGESARASVSIAYLDAYPGGFDLCVSARAKMTWDELRRAGAGSSPDVFGRLWPQAGESRDEIPSQLLRVGVRFADGRLATTIRGHEHPVAGPVLCPMSGSGTGGGPISTFSQGFWVSPLPPPGPFTLVCEWPLAQIPVCVLELEGQSVLDAAERARVLFSEHSVHRDGRDWPLATRSEVEWINTGVAPGMTITCTIPPIFDAYCTVVPPDLEDSTDEHVRHERALVDVLSAHSADRPWWLGYLDTGASDVVFPYAPRTQIYYGYGYVLVEAGPQQAAQWRERATFEESLPDLIFAADRSWLLSTMWDDDWTCLGGSERLIADLLSDPVLGARTRQVSLGEESTPPGHRAF